jgi:hypothetical protein
LLTQAQHFIVSRVFSLEEQIRARSLEDSSLAEALANAARYGVAEYLAAGPQLLKRWEDARNSGSHPLGSALVAAAVDLRRAGFTSPLPKALLEETAGLYLTQVGGHLQEESPESAWQWAALPGRIGASLLVQVGEDHCEVLDYLTDTVPERVQAPEAVFAEVIRRALPYADAADATTIAAAAQKARIYQVAEAAIRRALAIQDAHGHDNPPTLASRSMLVATLYALERLHEAETEARALLEDQTRVLGPDNPSTLASRRMLDRIQADIVDHPPEDNTWRL